MDKLNDWRSKIEIGQRRSWKEEEGGNQRKNTAMRKNMASFQLGAPPGRSKPEPLAKYKKMLKQNRRQE